MKTFYIRKEVIDLYEFGTFVPSSDAILVDDNIVIAGFWYPCEDDQDLDLGVFEGEKRQEDGSFFAEMIIPIKDLIEIEEFESFEALNKNQLLDWENFILAPKK